MCMHRVYNYCVIDRSIGISNQIQHQGKKTEQLKVFEQVENVVS